MVGTRRLTFVLTHQFWELRLEIRKPREGCEMKCHPEMQPTTLKGIGRLFVEIHFRGRMFCGGHHKICGHQSGSELRWESLPAVR